MKKYTYNAYSIDKKKINGEIEIEDDDNLREVLKKKKLILITSKINKKNFYFERKIKKIEIINFTSELGIMLESGIGIIESLKIQQKIVKNRKFKEIIMETLKKVIQGNGFGESLSNYKIFFGELYVSIVIVGEMGGNLPEALKTLAERMEESERVKKKIKMMMIYPIIVISLSGVLSLFLVFFILPQFIDIFQESKRELPLITKILVKIYVIFKNKYLYVVLISMFLISNMMIKKYFSKINELSSFIFIKIPLIKKIFITYSRINFLRNLYLLMKSGVSILKTLEILIELEKNSDFRKELHLLKENLKIGIPMSTSLSESIYFDKISVTMFLIGEESGTLLEMIEKNIKFTEAKFKESTDFFLIVLDPLLVVFLGLTVGIVVIGIYLPMFDMINLMG